MLSRGSLMSEGARGLPIGFKFFAGVNGVYDGNLTPVSVDANGQLVSVSHLWGVEVGLGAVGTRRWAHSSIGLSYSGAYRHYDQKSYYDGSDHTLSLDGRIDLTPHLALVTRNGAGTVSRTVNNFGGLINTPDSLLGLPSNEIFDNRAYFLQTTDDLMIRASARTSFVIGGDGYFVRRQSKALVGSDGYGAHGSIAYRLDRMQTLDVSYSYLHFDYPHAFGESDLNQITLGYARTLSRFWEMNVMGGGYKVETIGVTAISLDPVTAALFGQSTSYAAFHTTKYLPAIGATLRAKYKKSYVNFSYGRRPTPGNGVYLTSVSQSGSVGINYTGDSRWSFSAQGGYDQYSSIGQVGLGTFRTGSGGVGASYRINGILHTAMRVDMRKAEITTLNGYNRLGTRITISLNYSPGETPLALWR